MSTGKQKVNIFLKKFLTQQNITTNFLDYLHDLILESHVKLVPNSGVYSYPAIGVSNTVDTISVLTPGETLPGDGNGPMLEADDGHGRIMKLENIFRQNVPVPNELGTKYFVGMRFNYFPNETEINVRTGKIKWSLFEEAIGERAEPNVVSYYNNLLTMKIDSVCKGVDQIGRKIRVWLKEPMSQALGDTFEECIIGPQSITFLHDGGINFFDVPNERAGFFSIGQSLTIDQSPTSPTTTTVTLVGALNSGGTGFTRISVANDLTAYTVALGSFVLTGNNVINLVGTLGQGAAPSVLFSDYEVFLLGLTVTEEDLRLDEYYAYLFNYTGTGSGNNPSMFDYSDQIEVPQNLVSIVQTITNFKQYQLERNGFIFRGGGQFSFLSGVLAWTQAFEIVNPFRGKSVISASTLAGIVPDDVLYCKIYKEQPVIINGNASGEIWVEDTTDFNNGDTVTIGDEDSNSVTGFVSGAPGTEKLTIVDNLLVPIDLSGYTTAKGGWVVRVNTTLEKAQINQGALRPNALGEIDDTVHVVAIDHAGTLVFKNGVLKLEDGDVGEIVNLPSGFNWINNLTELLASITLTQDDGVGILAPKIYAPTATIDFNKGLSWVAMTNYSIIRGTLTDPLLEVTFDPTTAGPYMQAEFKNITFQNLGTGHVIQIDNTGATAGMLVVLDACVLLGSGGRTINVIHGEASQWIKVHVIDSKNKIFQGSIVFESQNNADELQVTNVKFAPSNYITIGLVGTDPSSEHLIKGCLIDQVNAVGSGVAKIINVTDSYAWNYRQKIDINGETSATFKMSQVIVNLRDFENYQRADNAIIFKGGGDVDFIDASDEFVWSEPLELVNPFYGVSIIDVGSLPNIAEGEILYTKLWQHHEAIADGDILGNITVKYTDEFNDNDIVLLGDKDSVKISGYVNGAPVNGVINVDDGGGTPINLSSLSAANGAWIKRVNIELLKGQVNVGDLKPDELGNIDPVIYIIGVRDGNTIIFKNGERVQKKWVYEESVIVDTPVDVDDVLYLPADSKNAYMPKTYQVGSGTLQFFINGVLQFSDQQTIAPSFTPNSYVSGTGVVSVPDGVDLTNVRREDIFRDSLNNEFSILGGVVNVPGAKQFVIGTGETVDLSAGAIIFRQDYIEPGVLHSWINNIQMRKRISENAKYTFRLAPIDKSALSAYGSGSTGNTLQESYLNGNTITVVAGTPIVISGPGGQKLLEVLGDMKVTGVIDPKGMTFSREGARPFEITEDGLWLDLDGRLNFFNKDLNLNFILDGFTETSVKKYTNPSPTVLDKGSVVTKAGENNIQYADWNTDALSRAIGILLEVAGEDEEKQVRKYGYVSPGIITADNFVEALLPTDRERIWLHASGKMTVTEPAPASGKHKVIMGIWDDGGLDLQVTYLGIA